MTAEAELLLMNASRAQLVREVIRPALAAGEIILCDRFYDSTTAYQGYGRGLDLEKVKAVIDFAVGETQAGSDPCCCTFRRKSAPERLRSRQENLPFVRDRIEEADRKFFERVAHGLRHHRRHGSRSASRPSTARNRPNRQRQHLGIRPAAAATHRTLVKVCRRGAPVFEHRLDAIPMKMTTAACRIFDNEYFYNMIENTIGEIEAKIHGSSSISDERKRELLQLLGTLKSEVGTLAKTHDEQASSIANFAQTSAHEATREKLNPESLEHSLQGLRSSVGGFEQSHPKLVQIVNSISNTLSNLGI